MTSAGILLNTMGKRKQVYNMDKIFTLLKMLNKDKRYELESYSFVMSSLDFTIKGLGRKGHVTGQELLEGIKGYALEQFGPMARSVLAHWGIKTTDDFGEIVFNMIDAGMLGKTECDSKEEFRDRFDFKSAFDNKRNYTIH